MNIKIILERLLLTVLITCMCSWQMQALAQAETVVKGKILDKDSGEPLHGASISEIDNDARIIKSASSDIEGNFVIRVTNVKNKLGISYVGYKTIVEPINGRTTIIIRLQDQGKEMDEVQVVAKRTSNNGLMDISERDLTTSVGKINAKDLEEMPAVSIDQAMQGRLAGVDITATSGDPGAAMNIRIRGTSSINSTGTPLIVVDGMPYETQIPSDFNFGTADEQGYAQLLSISPADIKDITVLKDAAATAQWGSKAANGVLVITTKRGGVGKPVITYTFKGALYVKPDPIPMLNGDQYSTLIPEAYINRIGTTLNTQTNREFNYDPNDPYWYYNYSNNTDWVNALAQQGYLADQTVSMTGGGEKARYFASVGYTNQQGITVGTDLQRINSRINLDYNISDRIKVFTSIAYTHSDQNRNYTSASDEALRGIAYKKMPNMSIYEYDELGNLTPNYFSPATNIQGSYPKIYNVVAMADKAKYNVLSERITPRFQVNYNIIKGLLRAAFDVQFDISNTQNASFLPQIATGRPATETVVNRAYNGDIDGFSVTTKTNLGFTPRIKNKNHQFQSSLNFITSDSRAVRQEVITSNTASSLLLDASIPARTQNAELTAQSGLSQTRSIGGVWSNQYGFKDRYIINVSVRGDGSSRFGPKYRYGLFPSISARYRLSEEFFLKSFKKLDDLSLRISYGISGNEPNKDYTFYSKYATFDWSYMGQSAIYPSSIELQNLRWEKLIGRNLGGNISLFKGRFRADVDLYRNSTKDMMYGISLPSYTGFSAITTNVGTMDNQGWEVAIWTTPYKTKNWTVGFDVNFSHNENIIREISEFAATSKGNVGNNGEYLRLLQVDNPFGSIYGYRFKGVYKDKEATLAKSAAGKEIIGPNGQQIYMRFNYPAIDYVFQPGDAVYEDINHDGNIDYRDVVYLGNSNPKLTGGFGPTITWKNKIKLAAFFSFRYDYDVVNSTKMSTTNMYGYDNQSTAVLRRWKKEGDVTDIPRAIINGGYNWLASDRYVEDASYLRFRTVSLRYTFDDKLLSKWKIKSLSSYFTVDNLYTFTKYTGQDPEITSRGGDPFRVATDFSMTPPTRTFTIGLVAGF